MSDEWKTIPHYPDYEVSDKGMVRRRTPGHATWPGRELKCQINVDGYRVVGLRVTSGAKQKYERVARLVLSTFQGPAEDLIACHNNGVRCDDRLENLRWGTHKDNQDDRDLHGTKTRGSDVCGSKLTANQVQQIRGEYRFNDPDHSTVALGKKFGVSQAAIHNIVKMKVWRHV